MVDDADAPTYSRVLDGQALPDGPQPDSAASSSVAALPRRGNSTLSA